MILGGVVQPMTMMYYPCVHPPRAVLWQALLYWDELTSISPEAGYQFSHDLLVLRDRGLYRPSHPDDLPPRARADLMSDLRQVVEELPGEDLVPVPGPLGPDNRLYWESCLTKSKTPLSKSAHSYPRRACSARHRCCCRV